MENSFLTGKETESSTPTYKLYSVKAITLASFFGAPVAGCILLAHNFRKLGNAKAATAAIIWGIVITIALMTICFFLPDKFPNSIIPAVYMAVIYQYAKRAQGDLISEHIKNGGKQFSLWKAFGIGMAALCVIAICVLGVAFVVVSMRPS